MIATTGPNVNAADAVRVELERREDAAVVVLVPHRRSRKKVTFGQISGGMAQPNVWIGD